jgi:dCTP deaminase
VILSGEEIRAQVQRGEITIEPFDPGQLNPNSYNYRLGSNIRLPGGDGTSVSVRIPEAGITLMPGYVYLGHTLEVIGSEAFVTSLIGRSSVGRLGLYLQLSADMGNLGPAHCWTLELSVVQPLHIYAGMKIGQVSFWRPLGDVRRYGGKYTEYCTPMNCLDDELGLMRP